MFELVSITISNWSFSSSVIYSALSPVLELWINKNRRKAIFNWQGGLYTHSGHHKTLLLTIAWNRISCETETKTHSEHCTLLKDFRNKKKLVPFLSGGCIITFNFHHYESNKLAINFKQETVILWSSNQYRWHNIAYSEKRFGYVLVSWLKLIWVFAD